VNLEFEVNGYGLNELTAAEQLDLQDTVRNQLTNNLGAYVTQVDPSLVSATTPCSVVVDTVISTDSTKVSDVVSGLCTDAMFELVQAGDGTIDQYGCRGGVLDVRCRHDDQFVAACTLSLSDFKVNGQLCVDITAGSGAPPPGAPTSATSNSTATATATNSSGDDGNGSIVLVLVLVVVGVVLLLCAGGLLFIARRRRKPVKPAEVPVVEVGKKAEEPKKTPVVAVAAAVAATPDPPPVEPPKKTPEPVPVAVQTFEQTRFFELYKISDAHPNFLDGITAMTTFIDGVGKGKDRATLGAYKKKIGDDCAKLNEVAQMGAYLWTTLARYEERELCSYINQAIREDTEPMVDLVVPVCRVINSMVVSGRSRDAKESAVMPTQTYRGSTMPAEAVEFFKSGKKYRTAMYLATSTKKSVAESFIRNNLGKGRVAVLFTINFDVVLGCMHINFLDEISAVKGEAEYLMPPYSGFEVESVKLDYAGVSNVTIKAFHDNTLPFLTGVPVASWH
jgi:hypothetical protein